MSHKKRIIGSLVSVFIIVAVAAAVWLVTSTGDGGGRIGTLQAPSVSPATAATACLPGGTCDAAITVNNPNASALTLTGGMPTGNSNGFTGSCPDSSIDVPTTGGYSVQIPSGTSEVHVPGYWHLASDASNTCQGLSFTKTVDWRFSTP